MCLEPKFLKSNPNSAVKRYYTIVNRQCTYLVDGGDDSADGAPLGRGVVVAVVADHHALLERDVHGPRLRAQLGRHLDPDLGRDRLDALVLLENRLGHDLRGDGQVAAQHLLDGVVLVPAVVRDDGHDHLRLLRGDLLALLDEGRGQRVRDLDRLRHAHLEAHAPPHRDELLDKVLGHVLGLGVVDHGPLVAADGVEEPAVAEVVRPVRVVQLVGLAGLPAGPEDLLRLDGAALDGQEVLAELHVPLAELVGDGLGVEHARGELLELGDAARGVGAGVLADGLSENMRCIDILRRLSKETFKT